MDIKIQQEYKYLYKLFKSKILKYDYDKYIINFVIDCTGFYEVNFE